MTPMPGGVANIPPEISGLPRVQQGGSAIGIRQGGRPIGIRQGGRPIGIRRSSRGEVARAPQGNYKTGRLLVTMERGSVKSGLNAINNTAGLKIASSSDFKDRKSLVGALEKAPGCYFEELGIAVVRQDPDQQRALGAAVANPDKPMEFCEEERFVFRCGVGSADYLSGYRDAIAALTGSLMGVGVEIAPSVGLAAEALDQEAATWGLQAIGAAAACYSGEGIRVAILDTGLDLTHPDFAGRSITVKSFTGEEFGDSQGHGTHCIGTACGTKHPGQLPRYGIAHGALIFAGKVLNNEGFGTDGGILAGIDWAISQNCEIVSMSLGAPVAQGESYSRTYEKAARRALRQGTLLIAAAGNESERPEFIAPVGRPANCPSIMAVAAVDVNMQVAWFSCAGINANGGQVDIAGPGVDVISSVPGGFTDSFNGTSMATPHVAGAAALWAQVVPEARGRALAHLLIANARRLELPSADVGAGLVQTP